MWTAIFSNPKTSITAIVGFLAMWLANKGIILSPNDQNGIVATVLLFLGLFARDGGQHDGGSNDDDRTNGGGQVGLFFV